MSPYEQSVFADATDAIQAVDLTFDVLVNEVDVSKMHVFLSDSLFDRERSGDKTVSISFGKADCTVFRKVMSTDDMVQEFARRCARTHGSRRSASRCRCWATCADLGLGTSTSTARAGVTRRPWG